MEKTPEEQNNDQPGKAKRAFGLLAAEAGMEFAFLIAVPLIAGVLGGKWLDNKYHHNFFVIIGLFLALAVSCISIYSRIKDYKNLLK